ncbi:universal stress protein [Desulfosporosinus lacus]|uniref:Universal stress protein family protein n=1 Tax=Desulfosporosinus lacus DSM 15449 TaxID=1121420 RepID=A0A1M6ARI2_9FIRM|nr:universal stress protein [Desulfosporosinus lacus]SHI38813.1 Universal stress protein family protein [Desulfosporosinus lacus DSM 15449]
MAESRFNVLLYLDDSEPAYYAVIYSAMLMMNMPNMHLTVVKLKESSNGLRESEDNWLNSGSINLNSDEMQDVTDIFKIRSVDVRHQVIYCNPNIPDTVDALIEFSRKKSIQLIVMGTGECRTIKNLIFGSLAHNLQLRSSIPVLLVKNFPEDYLDNYRSKPTLRLFKNDYYER